MHTSLALSVVQLWDTSGQERFASIARSSYRHQQVLIFAYDVGDKRSFEHVQRCWHDAEENWTPSDPRILSPIKVLLGLKSDLRGSGMEEVSRWEGCQLLAADDMCGHATAARLQHCPPIHLEELTQMTS